MKPIKIETSITNRKESPSLEKYLQEVSLIPQIPIEEERELLIQIKEGSQEAINKLCEANLRFVISVAKKYQNQSLTLNDLINEGNIGLFKAAKHFDNTTGLKFISYAVWWIRQSIMAALSNQSRLVRIPLNKIGDLKKIHELMDRLEAETGYPPTLEEIAQQLDLPEDRVQEALASNKAKVSIHKPIGGEEGGQELISKMRDFTLEATDHNISHSNSLHIDVNEALTLLNNREKTVITLFFGLEGKKTQSLEEIGEGLGLTRERARQIKQAALKKIKNSEHKTTLIDYKY